MKGSGDDAFINYKRKYDQKVLSLPVKFFTFLNTVLYNFITSSKLALVKETTIFTYASSTKQSKNNLDNICIIQSGHKNIRWLINICSTELYIPNIWMLIIKLALSFDILYFVVEVNDNFIDNNIFKYRIHKLDVVI